MTNAIIEELEKAYVNFKARGKQYVTWEELSEVVRAVIVSKYGRYSAIDVSVLYDIAQELRREEMLKRAQSLELSEEERRAMREAIEEVEKEYRDTTEVGSEDYKEAVKELAGYLDVFIEQKPRPGDIAQFLLSKFYFATFADSEELLLYRHGVYTGGAESFIKRFLEDAYTEAGKLGWLNSRFITEVVEHVKRSTLRSRSEFDRDKFIINVKNGLLDLRTLELKPHDPNYLSVIQLPVEWNPRAQCPRFDQFISEIVDPEDAKVLQEFAGYLLWRDCRFQKALMLVGSGANGKTTFLNIIIKVLGRHNCSFRSLQELMENRFAPADLYGKLANIYDDLPPTKLTKTGLFKMLVSGGEIQAEKKFRNPFKFRNYAKLVFSANKIPTTIDDTQAFFRRWIIINFPNEFIGDKADPHLEDKLSTPECLSYVLKWMLTGLKRLLENGKFSNEESIDEIEDKYLRMSNPVYAFLSDCTEPDPDAAVSKDELYHAFLDYCKSNKLPTVSKRAFGEHVKALARVTDGWVKINGKAVRAWRGIKFLQERG